MRGDHRGHAHCGHCAAVQTRPFRLPDRPLAVATNEARRRAATRTVWLTNEEFEALHDSDQSHLPDVDSQLRVDNLDGIAQTAAVEAQWAHARSR
jgi:hypothetical protein